jgi:CheY-like chemotaxis protein
LADDNRTNRRILEELLGRWGMKAVSTSNGQDALKLLLDASEAGEPFELLLTDVEMPAMDGFRLVELIRQRELAPPAIMMLTSVDQRGSAARCHELGVAAYLTKPIRPSKLREAILTVLGKSELKKPVTLLPRHSLREAVASRASLRVLLAEDNAVNQRLVVRLLEKSGHQVVVVNNGLEALAALDQESFDLVLMDVQMPEMDGFEATAAIREKEKESGTHQQIIALTAHAMKGDRDRCLAAGMDGYLSKPIQAKELFETTENSGPTTTPGKTDAPYQDASMSVLDSAAALARVEGDKQLLAELTNLFLEEGPKLLAAVREAVSRQDAKALEDAAHALKGSVGNFSAPGAFQAALNLEIMGRERDLAGAQEAYQLLNDQIERLQTALQALIKEVVG